jgi:penicillin-binding protein 1A
MLGKTVLGTVIAGALVTVLAGIGIYYRISPQLPSVSSLKDAQFQVPLRIYTQDGKLIAEFGDKKSSPIRYADIPPLLVKALISAEDDRFFEHPGVDYQGLVRAGLMLLSTGEKSQGGSTITMQVARNFFLTREKTYLRKVNEILLALKIDRELTKEEILELYLNKIYFGNRAYGVAAAAQVYYGKQLGELTLPEIATIVGLPKAPSRYNPIADEARSTLRRNYVLGRMHSLGYISDQAYEEARAAPETAMLHGLVIEVEAPHMAELVRQELVSRFGEETAYNTGLVVYTTLLGAHQTAANKALRSALIDYDRRHGFRGPLQNIADYASQPIEALARQLREISPSGASSLVPALVTGADEKKLTALLQSGASANVPFEGLTWAKRFIDENQVGPRPRVPADVAKPGDVVLLSSSEPFGWELAQVPAVTGALVALNPNDGAVTALVGGWDYYRSAYNRVTQAQRQPGSAFKPFIYAAGLDKGFTPASIINDAPVVFADPSLEAEWRPENYSGEFFGPTRLREALVNSRNLVSIRLLQSIGIDYALQYVSRFGFTPGRLPRNLSLALGSGAVTPLELARAHSVLANGGFLVNPYYIDRILDSQGAVLFQATPALACATCEETTDTDSAANVPAQQQEVGSLPDAAQQTRWAKRVVSPQTAYLVNSMMMDVVRRGTGRKAMSLGRQDLAGKTGTTNDHRDAWFVGFNADVLAVSWVGYDDPTSLGTRETGGAAALPMWMNFMAAALSGAPEHPLERPAGLVTVKIDPETGLLTSSDNAAAIFETFPADRVPGQQATSPATSPATRAPTTTGGNAPETTTEQLF